MATVQIKGNQIKAATIEAAKLDLSDNYTFTGDVQVPATPANSSSAVPKSYVLDLVQGLSYKDPVRVSDQSAISAAYDNSAKTLTANSNGAIDIDSISSPTIGDRILIRQFSGGARVGNGIYKITTVGDASNPFVLTRSDDMNESDEFRNATVFVSEGTDADVLFTQQTDSPTLGTDPILFVQISGAAGITAGDGLVKAGNTISANVGAGIEIVSDEIRAKIGDGLEDDSGTTRVKLDGSSLSRSSSGMAIASNGVQTIHLAAASVSSAKLDSNVAGDGLNGGAGSALVVNADNGISVSASGVSVNIDGSTLSKSGTGLKVAANGITATEISAGAVGAAQINSAIAGDGLAGGSGTALSIDLASNPALQFSSNKLDLKLVAAGSGLQKDANGLSIDLDGSTLSYTASGIKVNAIGTTEITNNAVTESKISSSIAGAGLTGGAGNALAVDLKPSNAGLEFVSDQLAVDLNSSAGLRVDTAGLEVNIESDGAIDFDLSNGGLEVQVDDSSIEISSNALQIKDAGVTTAKLQDDSVSLDKLKYREEFESFTGTGSATTFDLQHSVHIDFFKSVKVFRNGLRLKFVASNPADVDQYSVANNGLGSVCRVTLGAAPSSSDSLFVDYKYDVS